ncbi:MAG: DNA-directed RNA polymerase subunit omega [Clostridiales bacterium]|nr:DNA-directed RNA polymerase subunit omega [Clostridiales bacterium]
MMNQPPVNEIEVKAGCRYMLVTSVAKRARQIMRSGEDIGNEKPVSLAVEELNENKLTIKYPDEYKKTSEF